MTSAIRIVRRTPEPWLLEDVPVKLDRRAGLPGAFLFDRASHAMRNAKAAGVTLEDRLAFALPASWLVNSPAVSRVLRRWQEAPQREVWLALIEELEDGTPGPDRDAEIVLALRALGDEPYLVEAASKLLAVLVPDRVPLMPLPARVFVLGEARAAEPEAFPAMLAWFDAAVTAHGAALDAFARAHAAVPLSGAQVLDRMLWVDSEGFRHFASDAAKH